MKQIRESPDDLLVRWGHQLSTSGHAQWPEVDSLTDNLDIMDFIVATQFCCCKVDVFIRKIEVRDDMDVLKSLMISKSKMAEFLTQTYIDRCKVRRNRSYNTMDPQLNRLAKLTKNNIQ